MERETERKVEKETDRDQPMTCEMQTDCSDSSLPCPINPAACVYLWYGDVDI